MEIYTVDVLERPLCVWGICVSIYRKYPFFFISQH